MNNICDAFKVIGDNQLPTLGPIPLTLPMCVRCLRRGDCSFDWESYDADRADRRDIYLWEDDYDDAL